MYLSKLLKNNKQGLLRFLHGNGTPRLRGASAVRSLDSYERLVRAYYRPSGLAHILSEEN